MPALSLVIPCYNEAANLPQLIDRCHGVFAGFDVEVVLVDNGSSDDSPAILAARLADHPFIRSVRVEVNQGYGHGILTGLRASTGTVLGWTHADLQTDPLDALKGLERFTEAPDPERVFVKGSRYGRPVTDLVFTWGMAAFETALLRTPMWDINAQPTMFPKSFFDTWDDPPGDFSLDLFAYYSAVQAGLDMQRFSVLFAERVHGISRWNVNWQAKVKFVKRTVDYSFTMYRTYVAK